MKLLRYLLIAIAALLVVWIDLPQGLTGKPPTLDVTIFGKRIHREFTTKLGLDLQGGSHLVFEADTSKVKSSDVKDAIDSSRDIIEKRVNFFGVSEPQVTVVTSGTKHRINVDLPGVSDVGSAVSLIGSTAQLTFKEEAPAADPKEASLPAVFRLTKATSLGGSDVKKATVVFDPQTGKPQVSLTFTTEGGKKFEDITARNVGKPVGIYIDTFLISAPTVQERITGGTAVITGEFTIDEAKQLAIAVNSGALPVPIKLVEQRSIGPTLGAIEVKKSVVAGGVGLLAVMIFMIAYYGRLGLIACMGLIIYGLLSYALFRAIPVVLTLSGVAGFILSIGMAVDSNILIFERIKEELRAGIDRETAIRLGFGRALDAIKDANFTTLLVAFILFNPLNWDFFPQFGLVRGFALTLAIGVAMSLFTGVVITKRLINLFFK